MEIPVPPVELRSLVGRPDVESFTLRDFLLEPLDPGHLKSILDFGCGCGRLARHLMTLNPQPLMYEGLDLHLGQIAWCRQHLTPLAPQFHFRHHDVFNIGLNPGKNKVPRLKLPFSNNTFSLIYAWSVFPHILEEDAAFYLEELKRVLTSEGRIVATWFFFKKKYFPMMQDFQNALYINTVDPTNAVIFDETWFQNQLQRLGLKPVQLIPPLVRGFQWVTVLSADPNAQHVAFPEDVADFGSMPPPLR